LGDIGRIVLLGKMREDEMARAGVEGVRIGEKFADDGIGKMAGAAHHALLDVPGIRPDLQHFEIVIRFKNQEIGFAEMMFDQLGQISEIGDNGDFGAVGAEGVANGIDRVVRDCERIDFDVANLEALAGADVLDPLDGGFLAGLFGIFGVHLHDFAVCRLGEVGGAFPVARELGDGAGMVGMLVGDQDDVNALGLAAAESFKAAKNFLAAEAGIDEEGGAFGFEQRRVARAAGSENRDAERDAKSPLRMMAKCDGDVKGKARRKSQVLNLGATRNGTQGGKQTEKQGKTSGLR